MLRKMLKKFLSKKNEPLEDKHQYIVTSGWIDETENWVKTNVATKDKDVYTRYELKKNKITEVRFFVRKGVQSYAVKDISKVPNELKVNL